MKNKLAIMAGTVMGFAPLVALAQVTGQNPARCVPGATPTSSATIQTIICKLNDILASIVPLLIAVGVVFFVWGVVQYIVGGDEEAKKKGRSKMIYGIIGLAVIIALWGLVRILTNTFGLNNRTNIEFPTVPY